MTDDADQLAQRLRVGPRELTRSIGGPWSVAERVPEREIEWPGTLLVGRAGPSVALLVSDDADPEVRVGQAAGEWLGPGRLQWSLHEVNARLVTPVRGAADEDIDDFLARLGAAVEEAAAVGRPRLTACRYCGRLVGPEFAYDDTACYDCGSRVFGTVN